MSESKRKRLTAAAVERYQPGPGRREIPDSVALGLRLCVHRSGKKTWIWRYHRPSGRSAKLTLGEVDLTDQEQEGPPKVGQLLTVTAARALATECRRQLKMGVDPGAVYQGEKAGHRQRRGETFAVIAREFVERYCRPKNKRWRGTAQSLGFTVNKKTHELEPELRKGGLAHLWRDTPVSALTKRDLIKVIDEKLDAGAPYAGNARFALLRKFCNWCVERGVLDKSPLTGSKRPHQSKSRDRTLSNLELRALWRACDTQGIFGVLVKLLLLTGQRRDELRWLTWVEVAPDGAKLTLARVRTKNNTAHVVPLGPTARALLAALPRVKVGERESHFALTRTGRTPITGLSKLKKRLDTAMREQLAKLDEAHEWQPWRLHDCRRTASTALAALGFPQEHVEALRNHRSGKTGGLAGVYNRHSYDAEKCRCVEALDAWVASVVSG